MNRYLLPRSILVWILLTGVCAAPAAADSLTFVFDADHEDEVLDVPWVEQGLTMVVQPNLVSGPSAPLFTSLGLHLTYSELVVDLTPLEDVRRAEVEVRTQDDVGAVTYVEFRDGETVVASSTQSEGLFYEWLSVDAGGTDVDTFVVGGAMLRVRELVLRFGPVPAEDSSWGRVKVLFQ